MKIFSRLHEFTNNSRNPYWTLLIISYPAIDQFTSMPSSKKKQEKYPRSIQYMSYTRLSESVSRVMVIIYLPDIAWEAESERTSKDLFRGLSPKKLSMSLLSCRCCKKYISQGAEPPYHPLWADWRQEVIIWTNKIPSPPTGIGERYSQTISNLCQMPMWTPP